MSLVKTVELRILADAGDAQAKLDEIAAKADKLDADGIKMRFRVDDAAGKAQLDEIRAKADRLGFKDVSIKVRIDGAGRAVAELAAINHEADKGFFRKLLGGAGSVGGALFTPIGGGEGGGGGIGGLLTTPAAWPVIIGGAAALLTEVTGLASGFTAAGAGAGAFYLLAHPAINNLQGDVQALDKANQALGYAQQKYLIDPTKANAKALQNANDNYKAIFAQLKDDGGPAAEQMLKLHDAYVKMTNAFQPQAFKVLGDGLKILNNLLPAVKPFADTFANALDGLLKKVAQFTAVPPGVSISQQLRKHLDPAEIASITPKLTPLQQFFAQLRQLEGPAVTAIGEGIGKVAASLGKLLTTMNAADVSKSIGIVFNGISGAISGIAAAVSGIMKAWDSMSGSAKQAASSVAGAWKTMTGAVSAAASAIGGAVSAVIGFFSSMAHGAQIAVQGVLTAIGSLPGKIKGFFADAGSWLVAAGRAIVQGLINGIESMVSSAAGAIGHIASVIRSYLPFSPAKTGPLSGAGSVNIAGQKIVQDLIGGMASQLTGLHGILGLLAGAIAGAVRRARAGRLDLYPGVLMGSLTDPGPRFGMRDAVQFSTGGGIPSGDVHVHFHGVVGDPQLVALQLIKVLKEFKRHGGGAPLGIA